MEQFLGGNIRNQGKLQPSRRSLMPFKTLLMPNVPIENSIICYNSIILAQLGSNTYSIYVEDLLTNQEHLAWQHQFSQLTHEVRPLKSYLHLQHRENMCMLYSNVWRLILGMFYRNVENFNQFNVSTQPINYYMDWHIFIDLDQYIEISNLQIYSSIVLNYS